MQAVIGQTGRIVLSDEKIQFKLSQKRTVRYRYEKCPLGYRAVVVGPFHSRTYGANSFGTKRTSAKKALQRRLAIDYNYIGIMLLSDSDDADNIGRSAVELWHMANNNEREALRNAMARPISNHELCGSAGQ